MPNGIAIIYNLPRKDASDSLDVLTQLHAVEESLKALGHQPVSIPFSRDLPLFLEDLKRNSVRMVFNLCETVDENASLGGHPAAVLELLGIPFSGSPSVSLMISTDKMLTKQLVKSCGVLTPKSLQLSDPLQCNPDLLAFPVIVKPQFEDASIGIDQGSVFVDRRDLVRRLPEFTRRFGSVIIEEYINGREFNVSLMGYPSLAPLPLAEIDFSRLPQHLHRIVGYRAKWDPDSPEYQHTRRVFPENFSPRLRRRIETTAIVCARLLKIRDYGRIDMRVDNRENIYVLEANANPCLSPDSGFAAAAEKAGMSYDRMVERIIESVRKRAALGPATRDPEEALQEVAL